MLKYDLTQFLELYTGLSNLEAVECYKAFDKVDTGLKDMFLNDKNDCRLEYIKNLEHLGRINVQIYGVDKACFKLIASYLDVEYNIQDMGGIYKYTLSVEKYLISTEKIIGFSDKSTSDESHKFPMMGMFDSFEK